MDNPFDEISARLTRIENLLLKQNTSARDPVIPESDKVLTVAQAASFLNTTPGAIYQLVHKGDIPYSKKGRLYFSEKELRQWIHSSRRQTISEIQVEGINGLSEGGGTK